MKLFASFIGVVLLLLFPAFWNGFPLVYSDTGSYIASGFENSVPLDRPLVYGFIIRHTSLASTLWFTVLMQALFAALTIYFFAKLFFQKKISPRIFFLLGCGMAVFSTLPWYSSFLMADAFSGISFLLFFILMFGLNRNPWQTIIIILFYCLFTATHLSHVNAHFLLFVFTLLLWTFKRVRKLLPLNKVLLMGFLVSLNYLFIPAFHGIVANDFSYPKRSYYFMSARFAENGSMKLVLDKKCKDANWQMCQFKDSLPNSASNFLWTEISPLNRLKGWEKELVELKEINTAILTNPKLIWLNVKYIGSIAAKQTFSTSLGEEFLPYDTISPVGWEIAKYFRSDLSLFLHSKQHKNMASGLNPPLSNWMYFCLFFSILILMLSVLSGFGSNLQNLMITFVLFAYFANVLSVSVASEGGRYNSRFYWVIVLFALLLIFKYFQERWIIIKR